MRHIPHSILYPLPSLSPPSFSSPSQLPVLGLVSSFRSLLSSPPLCSHHHTFMATPQTTPQDLDYQIDTLADQVQSLSNQLRDMRNTKDCSAAHEQTLNQQLRAVNKQLQALLKQKPVDPATIVDKARFTQNRPLLENSLKRRFFYGNSFSIYGGVAGLYDYGPPGCAVKNNLVALWRQHFVLEENMLELEATVITPKPVLEASGHVEKFTDLMVKDQITGECFRADHLVADHIECILEARPTVLEIESQKKKSQKKSKKTDENSNHIDPDYTPLVYTDEQKEEMRDLLARIDELDPSQMASAIQKYDVRAPTTANKLTDPFPFNLMFATMIGPTGVLQGYLRPETAQGIFVNFKRLLDYNGNKMPFACAQIGSSFRNEISPQQGLLRVREFMQAEIEHFVHPDYKDHPKFDQVKDLVVNLFPRKNQITTRIISKMTVQDAVQQGIIANQTLAYFIARVSLFAQAIGLDMNQVRFRQHLEHEMAHYASDCWDWEVQCSYGWIECAGLADRSCFDLKNHTAKGNEELTAYLQYDQPKKITELQANFNKGALGKQFKKAAQTIMAVVNAMTEEQKAVLDQQLQTQRSISIPNTSETAAEEPTFILTPELLSFASKTTTVAGETYYPSVIEPSFGIGRILYCVFEHVFYPREGGDEARTVLALPPVLASIKTAIMPISKNEKFDHVLQKLNQLLVKKGISSKVDDSGVSIGKRYSRMDEIGVPFGITVDFQTLEDGSITLRERDSMKQVRGSLEEIINAIAAICNGLESWADVQARLPAFDSSVTDK